VSNILVTGPSGFIGKALVSRLLDQGHKVFGLYRKSLPVTNDIVILTGDVLEENLGLNGYLLPHFERVYNLAGIVNLGHDRDGMTFRTNVVGTDNVIRFCAKYEIPHLLFCSTAYTQGRNVYESSKALAELLVEKSDIPKKTIFKPSIVLGTPEYPYGGHFSQFVSTIVRVHRRAEKLRRAVEDGLRLPVLRPVFRAKGNPDGRLNLVRVDQVVEKMAKFTDPGTFWLTNPHPPTLKQLTEWISESILVDFKIEPEFKATPIESQLARMVSAFVPYLQGDDFPSDIKDDGVTEEFIKWTINTQLERG
jgi:nucleoside-diphosphate-sugar epimerase